MPLYGSWKEIDMDSSIKKSKIKINVIDVVIILMILALIAVGVNRVYSAMKSYTSSQESDTVLTFECSVEYDDILKYLKDGDNVYLSSDKTLLGYLHDRSSGDELDAVYEVEDNDISKADTVTLRGTIMLSSKAVKMQNGDYYVLNGMNITVGSRIDVYTETAQMTITVKDISE